jgi:hypothetical protein
MHCNMLQTHAADPCTPTAAGQLAALYHPTSSRKDWGLTPNEVFALATPKSPLIGVRDGNVTRASLVLLALSINALFLCFLCSYAPLLLLPAL